MFRSYCLWYSLAPAPLQGIPMPLRFGIKCKRGPPRWVDWASDPRAAPALGFVPMTGGTVNWRRAVVTRPARISWGTSEDRDELQ